MKMIVEAGKRELQEVMGGCNIFIAPGCKEFSVN